MKRLRFAPLTSVVTLVLCTSLLACSVQKSAPPPMYVHTVSVQGETLGLIADWYTGSSQNWRSIAANNPGLNPNRLRLGDEVMIPESMTIRTEPLTRKYVESATRRTAGLGDTFAKTTSPNTLPPTGSETSPASTDGSNDTPSLAPSGVTPQSDAADPSAAAVKAAEEATAAANQASAKAAEAAQQAAAQAAENANQEVEAAKQEQVAAEEAARRASAAAADAAAKASESAKNTVAQATSDTAAVAADSANNAPASDRPKSKDELLKELLEDK